jgi:hypothetical protein
VDHETLRRLAKADERAKLRRNVTHAALVAAVWQAADEGMPQSDIVRGIGLTRERVRQLCDPVYRDKHEAAYHALLEEKGMRTEPRARQDPRPDD